ncbi:MAG: hypothetical protein IPJ81_00580 [Chitinophagaceae bacterium]|nr:hypothetical protein [Chitinophagaceae bacterium]
MGEKLVKKLAEIYPHEIEQPLRDALLFLAEAYHLITCIYKQKNTGT